MSVVVPRIILLDDQDDDANDCGNGQEEDDAVADVAPHHGALIIRSRLLVADRDPAHSRSLGQDHVDLYVAVQYLVYVAVIRRRLLRLSAAMFFTSTRSDITPFALAGSGLLLKSSMVAFSSSVKLTLKEIVLATWSGVYLRKKRSLIVSRNE